MACGYALARRRATAPYYRWLQPDVNASPGIKPPVLRNKGEHVIHMGGKFDSHLLVPVISKGPLLGRRVNGHRHRRRYHHHQ